jgi:purine-binding chemotaxis protein CheW
MAQPSPRPGADALHLVCFHLHDQEYGVEIASVKETLALRPIVRMFLTPDWLAGIMNLRGDVVSVIDLSRFLGMPRAVAGDDGRIVVVRHKTLTAGVLVDRMADVRVVPLDRIAPVPATVPAETASLMRGIATIDGGAVRVLDVAALFESERVQALRRGGT